MHPASLREYIAGDGWAMLLLPVAMSGRSYASPHWRIVALEPCSERVPPCSEHGDA